MYEYAYKKANCFLLIVILIVADQFSKHIIRSKGGFYVCNSNLAFGINFSLFAYILIFVAISVLMIAVAKSKSQKTNSKQILNTKILNLNIRDLFDICNLKFGILLIISGGLSNIIDRVLYGCVTDFIDLKVWPVFNLADVFIAIGSIMIIMKHSARNTKQR